MNWWEIESLLFPPSCIICNAPGFEICEQCKPIFAPRISVIDESLPQLLSGYEYDSFTGKILLQAKEENSRVAQHLLGHTIATLISIAHHALQRDSYLILGVPSSPATIRRRGFLHLERVVRVAQKISPLSLDFRPILQSSKGVRDQTELVARARSENVTGKFRVSRAIDSQPGRGIILIDDVVSSGSSIRESVRALHMANLRPDLLISACLGHLGRLGDHQPSNRMLPVTKSGYKTENRKRSA